MTDYPSINRDHLLLQESIKLVAPAATELIAAFYDKLFTAHPELRPMFPDDMTQQRERLLKAVIAVATKFDRPEELRPALIAMGRTHANHGVTLSQYAIVGNLLLEALREFAGGAWTPSHAAAWERAYTFAAGTMMATAALEPMGERRNGLRQAA